MLCKQEQLQANFQPPRGMTQRGKYLGSTLPCSSSQTPSLPGATSSSSMTGKHSRRVSTHVVDIEHIGIVGNLSCVGLPTDDCNSQGNTTG